MVFPGGDARWPNSLAGAPDSGDILFTLTEAVDLAGGPCDAATVDPDCRINVLMLRRNATTGRWCGAQPGTCRAPPFRVDSSFFANGDTAGQQQDQALPVPAFYSYGQTSVYWMDFGVSPLVPGSAFRHDDTRYDYHMRLTRYAPGAGDRVVATAETLGWPSTLVPIPYDVSAPNSRAYGDVDFMAAAPLHGHSIHVLNPITSSRVVTILSSPRSPPE